MWYTSHCDEAPPPVPLCPTGFQFVLSAGNNFLPAGLPLGAASSPQSQSRFSATWGSVYGDMQIPWYLVGGYADWLGNCTAERAFTAGASSRWQYPDLWHSFNVAVPPDWGTMQVVMLDTVTLAGAMQNNPGDHDIPQGAAPPPPKAAAPPGGAAATATSPQAAFTYSTVPEVPTVSARRRLRDFNANLNPPISTLQWSWLQSFLAASTAQWLVVVGNDPIWSAGAHGPTWALVDQLLPMLDAAGVALYISGRDPLAQHFTPSMTYPSVDFVGIGIGAGGNASQAASLPSLSLCPEGTLSYSYGAGGGFLSVSMGVDPSASSKTLMTVSFYDETGALLHSFQKPNPRKTGVADPPGAKVSGKGASGKAMGQGALILLFFVVVICGGGGYFLHLSSEADKKSVKTSAAHSDDGAMLRRGAKRAGVTEQTPLRATEMVGQKSV